MAAPSFLDLAEEAPAALGSEAMGAHFSASFSYPIKALSVYQGLDCADGQKPGLFRALVGLTWALECFLWRDFSPEAFLWCREPPHFCSPPLLAEVGPIRCPVTFLPRLLLAV